MSDFYTASRAQLPRPSSATSIPSRVPSIPQYSDFAGAQTLYLSSRLAPQNYAWSNAQSRASPSVPYNSGRTYSGGGHTLSSRLASQGTYMSTENRFTSPHARIHTPAAQPAYTTKHYSNVSSQIRHGQPVQYSGIGITRYESSPRIGPIQSGVPSYMSGYSSSHLHHAQHDIPPVKEQFTYQTPSNPQKSTGYGLHSAVGNYQKASPSISPPSRPEPEYKKDDRKLSDVGQVWTYDYASSVKKSSYDRDKASSVVGGLSSAPYEKRFIRSLALRTPNQAPKKSIYDWENGISPESKYHPNQFSEKQSVETPHKLQSTDFKISSITPDARKQPPKISSPFSDDQTAAFDTHAMLRESTIHALTSQSTFQLDSTNFLQELHLEKERRGQLMVDNMRGPTNVSSTPDSKSSLKKSPLQTSLSPSNYFAEKGSDSRAKTPPFRKGEFQGENFSHAPSYKLHSKEQYEIPEKDEEYVRTGSEKHGTSSVLMPSTNPPSTGANHVLAETSLKEKNATSYEGVKDTLLPLPTNVSHTPAPQDFDRTIHSQINRNIEKLARELQKEQEKLLEIYERQLKENDSVRQSALRLLAVEKHSLVTAGATSPIANAEDNAALLAAELNLNIENIGKCRSELILQSKKSIQFGNRLCTDIDQEIMLKISLNEKERSKALVLEDIIPARGSAPSFTPGRANITHQKFKSPTQGKGQKELLKKHLDETQLECKKMSEDIARIKRETESVVKAEGSSPVKTSMKELFETVHESTESESNSDDEELKKLKYELEEKQKEKHELQLKRKELLRSKKNSKIESLKYNIDKIERECSEIKDAITYKSENNSFAEPSLFDKTETPTKIHAPESASKITLSATKSTENIFDDKEFVREIVDYVLISYYESLRSYFGVWIITVNKHAMSGYPAYGGAPESNRKSINTIHSAIDEALFYAYKRVDLDIMDSESNMVTEVHNVPPFETAFEDVLGYIFKIRSSKRSLSE